MKRETLTGQIEFKRIEFDHNKSTLIEVLGVDEEQFDRLMLKVKEHEHEIIRKLGKGNKTSIRLDAAVNSDLPDKVKVLAIFHYGYIQGVLQRSK